jgi:transposase-like protein
MSLLPVIGAFALALFLGLIAYVIYVNLTAERCPHCGSKMLELLCEWRNQEDWQCEKCKQVTTKLKRYPKR